MQSDRTLGHRAPLLWLVLPFLCGFAAGRAGAVGPVSIELALALIAAGFAWHASPRKPRLWGAALSAAMLLAGNASYGLHVKRPAGWEGMPEREARLSLRLDRVFPGAERTRPITGTGTVMRAVGRWRELEGQPIYFSLRPRRGEASLTGSATVYAAGLIAIVPRDPPPQSFDSYLVGLGVNFHLSRGYVLALQHPPTAYRLGCDNLARRMNELLGIGIEHRPALAAIYRAMMLGRRRGLSPGQRQLFLQGGAMHLFAINGLHIGVVAVSLHALLALLRCPRALACLPVLAVLWLDVDTTGTSPSAVRAFLMVGVLETAWMLHRPGNPLAALSVSALLVLLVDPTDCFSASFQMSYAVVAAIFSLGLPLGSRLLTRFQSNRNLPRISWSWRHRGLATITRHLAPAVGVGTAAALVSAVAGVEFFGLFAPVGILANLVVAPLASLVIVAGFASIVAGLAGWIAATRLFNSAAGILLASIDALLRRGTAWPGAWFPAHYRSTWIGPAALALLVASCLAGYAANWRRARGSFWPSIAIVALALACGVQVG